MKRYINHIIILLIAFLTGGPVLTSCEDIDEITELNLDRVLSPVNLATRISNKVNAIVSWDLSNGADQYVIELYAGKTIDEGTTPVKTYTIGSNEVPYTISGLDGESDYTVRVKGTTTDGSKNDSKWSSKSFKTDAEQIFHEVASEDIEATQVTLRWPAGEYAQTITLTPGGIIHDVTSTEIANGAALITGLSGETTYTAKLMNGEKTRGTITFTTPVDTGDAILIENSEELINALANLEGGETLALLDGTYIGTGEALNFNIEKTVSITPAKSGGKVTLNGNIRLKVGAGLTLTNITLDGINGSGDQTLIFQEAGANGAVTLEGCEIKNYLKGVFYINYATSIEKLTINNCLIYDIECNGGELFDCRKGVIKEFTLSNSTVYNSCISREFIRMDDAASSFPGVEPVINVTNNTLVGICNSSSSRRLLYVRFKGNSINFKKNIVYGTKEAMFSDNSSTAKPVFENNNYYNCPNLIAVIGEKSKFCDDSSSMTQLDPQFANASESNFTVGNQDIKDMKIGDPRWF